MSRTRHHKNQASARQGCELWKPRPLRFASKNAANLKLERRITRHLSSAEMRKLKLREAFVSEIYSEVSTDAT